MEPIVQEEGKLIVHNVFDCVTSNEGLPIDKLLLTKDRYAGYNVWLKPHMKTNFNCPGDDADFPWRLEYHLHGRCADSEDVAVDVVTVRFDSEANRTTFEDIVNDNTQLSDVHLCIHSKFFDRRLFDLCIMLPNAWLMNRENAWQLAGFFHRRPHADCHLMLQTYACVLATQLGSFDLGAALETFHSWSNPKWNPKLTEGTIKSIVGGVNKAGYDVWKNLGKTSGIVVEDIKDVKNLDDPKKRKSEMLDAIAEELAQLPKDLFLADNEYFVKDLAKQRDWADYKQLAYAIKSSYAYVLNGQNAIFLKKMAVMEHFSF